MKLTSLQPPDRDVPLDKPSATKAARSLPWRLATRDDHDRIVAMNERLNLEDPSETMPFDAAMMRSTLAEIEVNPIRGAVAVLDIEHKICGYALLISFWSNECGGEICAIDELYVGPDVRGRGFASQFVDMLASCNNPIWPRRTALIVIEAYRTNPRAKALYERLGFRASPNHTLTMVPGDRGR